MQGGNGPSEADTRQAGYRVCDRVEGEAASDNHHGPQRCMTFQKKKTRYQRAGALEAEARSPGNRLKKNSHEK